ncbi:MAG TPA: DUF2946 family protein [Steroidobacteraceae bacterium]|nr:DUF2946 family protein [Steroidobacteraceae bacterium]
MTGTLSQLRTRRRLAWLLMPAFLLRALIPLGFMPFAGPGGAYLGLCPGAGALPPTASELAAHASHAGHTHHPGGAPGSPGSHQPCVFSGGAATGFAAMPSAAPGSPVLHAPAERVASLVFLPPILRAQSSRGPPVVA